MSVSNIKKIGIDNGNISLNFRLLKQVQLLMYMKSLKSKESSRKWDRERKKTSKMNFTPFKFAWNDPNSFNMKRNRVGK
jgi:hypothetical protein